MVTALIPMVVVYTFTLEPAVQTRTHRVRCISFNTAFIFDFPYVFFLTDRKPPAFFNSFWYLQEGTTTTALCWMETPGLKLDTQAPMVMGLRNSVLVSMLVLIWLTGPWKAKHSLFTETMVAASVAVSLKRLKLRAARARRAPRLVVKSLYG